MLPNFFFNFVRVDQIKKSRRTELKLKYTLKPLYNYHPWDPKVVSVVERWSLFRGHLCNKSFTWDLEMVVILDRWSLFGGGQVSSGLTAQKIF